MTDNIQTQLQQLKHYNLSENARKLIQSSNKAQRKQSYGKALIELANQFDDKLSEAMQLAFNLHAGQIKKLKFKKDRIKIFKQHGIDYPQLDGYQTAEVLSLIRQSLIHEDGVVTTALHDAFHFWKEGFEMVQLDLAFETLAEDIQIHFGLIIDQLLEC